MQIQEYQNIFDTLNSTRRTTRECVETLIPFWPDKKPQKTTITVNNFWLLNDVLGAVKNLDTETYQYQSTIGNILHEYAPANMLPNEKFKLFDNHVHVIEIGDEQLKAEISRYAAWAIIKEIGKHNNTTFHQEYFICPNQNFDQIHTHVRHICRITEREQVTKYYKQVNGILGHLTKRQKYFTDFHEQLFTWLFGTTKITKIQNYYRIPENKPIADYMNDTLMTAFATALKNIVQRYDKSTYKNYNTLYEIAKQEMVATRKIFTTNNDDSALNMCTASVEAVQKDRTRREQEFVNKYIQEKVR